MSRPDENPLRDSVVAFMEDQNLKPTPWALKAGVPESTLRSFLDGTVRSMRHDNLDKLARAAGVTIEQMTRSKAERAGKDEKGDARNGNSEQPAKSGQGSKNRTEPGPESVTMEPINVRSMTRDVPILGVGSCGEDGLFELNGQIHDHARRPPRLAGVKDAYALWVIGESMFPWRKNGQLVYVHPHQPVNIGDYVVVQVKPETPGGNIGVFIKELSRRTAKELRLRQYNPPEDRPIPMSKVLQIGGVPAIHRIVDWSELMGI